ncbi:glycerophosphodiester phosphodiesterase family protein [Frigoribacterium salinisoli]
MPPRPLVIAHRGASGHRPEHGEAAYRLAIELGAEAIEPDLVPTKDGVLALRHENEVSGTTDVAERPDLAHLRTTKVVEGQEVTGWFTEDLTWAELSTLRVRERLPRLRPASAAHDGEGRVQRLEDLLRLLDDADRPVGLVAELKHATYFAQLGLPLDELVADALAAAGWTGDDRLAIESFEEGVLHQVQQRGVGGRLVWLVEASGAPADLVARLGEAAPSYASLLDEAHLAQLAASGVAGISVAKRTLVDDAGRQEARVVERAHAAGLEVWTWTLRAENAFLAKAHRLSGGKAAQGDWRAEFGLLMDLGVDAVFADQPELALAVRDGR